ncbi:unnamed protein product, partial [Didymodactylos carnosus]
MAHDAPPSTIHKVRVEWMWKSNTNPWCPLQAAEWRSYSDIEIDMIEQAFNKKETHVLLDNFHIIFEHFIQISNTDERNQRLVKRCIVNKTEEKLREERFFANAITPTKVFTEGWSSESIFIKTTLGHFDLNNYPLSDYQRRMLVDSACKGLLIEGKEAGKLRQAMWMEQQLIMVKNGTEREIAETCAYLYTTDSFLHRKLNECMKLLGDDKYENFWRSKVSTLGPFAYLFRDLSILTMNSRKATVYRGMNLCDDLIKQLIEIKEGEKCSLPAFTSTSRNREKAVFINGNVLVEIDIDDVRCVAITTHGVSCVKMIQN